MNTGYFRNNPLLNTDSYKVSHYLQYPLDARHISYYIESRGGKWSKTVFFGMQMFIEQYMLQPFTMMDINEAEEILTAHGEPFNREGFEYILEHHNGYFPVEICSVDEGTILPTHNVLVQIVNTDANVPWVTSFLETALLRAIWYATTVATNSYECKKIIHEYMKLTSDNTNGLMFKMHDFGARGVSSRESAGIGGAAHLVNFMGTDTLEAVRMVREYYSDPIAGFSIPASEHSTITCWGGPDFEIDAFENMIDKFGGKGKIVACVSDSYNIWESAKKWKSLEKKILEKEMTLVIRPDSGDPVEVVTKLIQILMDEFGYTVNSRGYKVLPNHIRVIQGDGINVETIGQILGTMTMFNLSADNIAFGQGGALLQQLDRDTLKFAMKASAIYRSNSSMRGAHLGGAWHDVYKQPVTDGGKVSKRGLLRLEHNEDCDIWMTKRVDDVIYPNKLILRYRCGKAYNKTTFAEIRERANKEFK